ncbi:uncharacterized protein LOC119357422 [Triticum dicoccoides]|uniref:uncharacterized protein LOC119357422 n=1 Tax=Triticum dicoccoides TaxID=85692 RepID=UPI00188F1CFA|nr:uncharacterized protein LOC119357422 [Triticum dicoccoides]
MGLSHGSWINHRRILLDPTTLVSRSHPPTTSYPSKKTPPHTTPLSPRAANPSALTLFLPLDPPPPHTTPPSGSTAAAPNPTPSLWISTRRRPLTLSPPWAGGAALDPDQGTTTSWRRGRGAAPDQVCPLLPVPDRSLRLNLVVSKDLRSRLQDHVFALKEDSTLPPVASTSSGGRPARVVPAVGSPGRPDGEPEAPVRGAGLDRVLHAECVRRLQLRPLARVPHHAPEHHWILESDRDPAGALQLDGAGLSVQGEFAGPDEEPKQHQVTHAASKGRYARFKENLNAKPLETKQNHHQVDVSCATSKGRHWCPSTPHSAPSLPPSRHFESRCLQHGDKHRSESSGILHTIFSWVGAARGWASAVHSGWRSSRGSPGHLSTTTSW